MHGLSVVDTHHLHARQFGLMIEINDEKDIAGVNANGLPVDHHSRDFVKRCDHISRKTRVPMRRKVAAEKREYHIPLPRMKIENREGVEMRQVRKLAT